LNKGRREGHVPRIGAMKNANNFQSEILDGREHLRDLDEDGMIILK
jgi:hypothetical protein